MYASGTYSMNVGAQKTKESDGENSTILLLLVTQTDRHTHHVYKSCTLA